MRPLRAALRAHRGSLLPRALWSLGTSVAAYGLCFALGLLAWAHAPLLLLLLAPLGGLALVRLFCIQHDCGHGSFFGARWANDALGRAIAVATLAPYAWWRATHAHHHAVVNKLDHATDVGYFDLWTVAQWRAASPGQRLGYRLQRSAPFLALIGGPLQFIFFHRLPPGTPPRLRRTLWGVLGLNLTWVGILAACAWGGVLVPVLAVQLAFAWAAAGIGAALFLNQHTFEGAVYADREDWEWGRAALHGSARLELPRWLAWFTADIGLHHIHHLDGSVPHYRLREALAAVPGLQQVRAMGMAEAFAESRLALWDPDRGALVSFDAVAP